MNLDEVVAETVQGRGSRVVVGGFQILPKNNPKEYPSTVGFPSDCAGGVRGGKELKPRGP